MAPRPSHRPYVLDEQIGFILRQVVQRHVAIFGSFYVSMIRVGEMTGRLTEVFLRLNEHMALCWLSPSDPAFAALDWAAADLPIVNLLREGARESPEVVQKIERG